MPEEEQNNESNNNNNQNEAVGSSDSGDVNVQPQQINPHPELQKRAQTSQAPVQSNEPEKSKKRWFKNPLLYVAIFVALLVLGGGAYAAYEQIVAPKTAVLDFIEVHSDEGLQAFSYNGNIDIEMKGETTAGGEIAFSGAADQRDDKNLLSLGIDGEYGAEGINLDIVADTVVDEDMFYFKIDQPELVEMFLPGVIGSWYKTDLTEQVDESVCEEAEVPSILSGIKQKLEENSPFINTQRVGWGFETVDGVRTSHYSGEVNLQKLMETVQAVEDEVKTIEGCEDFEAGDYDENEFDDLEVSYDVWLGPGLSKMQTEFNSEEADVTVAITTTDYNQDVGIEIPQDAEDFEQAMQSLQQGEPSQSQAPVQYQFNDYEMQESQDLDATSVLGLDSEAQSSVLNNFLRYFTQ